MNNPNRAAQFNPFDSLKGLQEELRAREERYSRVEKRELTEEQMDELSQVLCKVKRGSVIEMTFFDKGHYYELKGTVADINAIYGYIVIGQRKIDFCDISEIRISQ